MRRFLRLAPLAMLAVSASVGAADAPDSQVAVLTGAQVIQILDETVQWYRTLGAQQQVATQPSDLLMLYANRQTADKAMALAFEIARANAELLSSEATDAQKSADDGTSVRALDATRKKLGDQRDSIQQEIAAARRRSSETAPRERPALEAKISELQGELDMVNARRNLLDTMTQFVSERGTRVANVSALKAHIDAIADSIPATLAAPVSPASGAGTAASGASSGNTGAVSAPAVVSADANASDRVGIWDLAGNALRLSRKMATLESIDRRTAALEETFAKIRAPPLRRLDELTASSDALSKQADVASGATLEHLRDQFDTLAWLFQQTSAILIPLSKEGILLQQYRQNLQSWRETLRHEFHNALVALAVRIAVLLGMLAVVALGAEVWRRVVVRFAPEARRRYQLLLVRRVTVWSIAVAIVAFTFVTRLSTFATFAGLLTAGVAVAMQSVLVSLVGYFFLIGKYGIRIGDRVQVGAVTGEVIELGLVRMHLLELNAQGLLGPTGRVVAFANSIVFQAAGGLFKQISGVSFTWHEITVAVPEAADPARVKDRLLAAANEIVAEYRHDIVRQTRQMQSMTSSTALGDCLPQVQLRFSATAVEAIVRYPVPLEQSAQVDERMSHALLQAVASTG